MLPVFVSASSDLDCLLLYNFKTQKIWLAELHTKADIIKMYFYKIKLNNVNTFLVKSYSEKHIFLHNINYITFTIGS